MDENANEGLRAVRDFGDTRAAFWANPPRGQCTHKGCPETDAILHGDPPVCAYHYRHTQADRDRPYPCDNCGEGPAFRDPADREDEYLCPRCHEKRGYVPTERAMITKTMRRVGVTHSRGQRAVCIVASAESECHGQVKPRGKLGVLCDFHFNPKKYLAGKG